MLPPKYNPALFVFQEPTFKHDDALKQVDCIMTVVGVDEEILYSKSHALQVRTGHQTSSWSPLLFSRTDNCTPTHRLGCWATS